MIRLRVLPLHLYFSKVSLYFSKQTRRGCWTVQHSQHNLKAATSTSEQKMHYKQVLLDHSTVDHVYRSSYDLKNRKTSFLWRKWYKQVLDWPSVSLIICMTWKIEEIVFWRNKQLNHRIISIKLVRQSWSTSALEGRSQIWLLNRFYSQVSSLAPIMFYEQHCNKKDM